MGGYCKCEPPSGSAPKELVDLRAEDRLEEHARREEIDQVIEANRGFHAIIQDVANKPYGQSVSQVAAAHVAKAKAALLRAMRKHGVDTP